MEDFLPGGNRAVFVSRNGSERANKYWPLFLAEILRNTNLEKLYIKDKFDISLEWLLVLTDPEPTYDDTFSYQYYCKSGALIRHESSGLQPLSRLRLLKDAIDIIREIHQGSKSGRFEALPGHLISRIDISRDITGRETKLYYSHMLKQVMGSMQFHLEIMVPGTASHFKYLEFCQGVVSHIRSRASNIQPLTSYFTISSSKYWPEGSDPTLYAAGIVSYSLRLRDDDPGRVSAELFHYLWRGWQKDFINGQIQNHVSYIKKGLRHFEFLDFMLNNYMPAMLQAAFSSDCGWIMCSIYFPLLAKRIIRATEKLRSNTPSIVSSSIILVKAIINSLITQSLRWEDIRGTHPLNRGIIAIACQFWLSIIPSLQAYVQDFPDQRDSFDAISKALKGFSQYAIRRFEQGTNGGWSMEPLVFNEGPYVTNFVSMMLKDINAAWTTSPEGIEVAMAESSGWVEVVRSSLGDRGRHRIDLSQFWGRTLIDVIGIGLCHSLPSLPAGEGRHGYRRLCLMESHGSVTRLSSINSELFF